MEIEKLMLRLEKAHEELLKSISDDMSASRAECYNNYRMTLAAIEDAYNASKEQP